MDITMNAQVCTKTDIGLKREKNEDSFLVVDRPDQRWDIQRHGRMYVVADGMGGHAGGEIASKMACRGMADYYSANTDSRRGRDYLKVRLQHLKSSIDKVHDKIIEYGRTNKKYEDMGTTLSALVLIKNKALIAHVGDSRIYRLRQGRLQQLTEDHTMAQLFIRMGYLTPEKVANHPIRHVMSQAVGQGVENIFLKIEKVEQNDTFLLCSDGLYDMVSDNEIRDTLLQNPAVKDQCRSLVARALKNGGRDNVTVMVVHV
jgi:serine/threonine protein phosphatase PrpC